MIKTKVTTGTVVLLLLIGLSGAAVAGREIPLRNDKADPRHQGYEYAYRDGSDHGRFDRAYGIRSSLHARVYNDTARGWQPSMGNKGQYQQGYREGYKAGYDSGYHRATDQRARIDGCTDATRRRWSDQG